MISLGKLHIQLRSCFSDKCYFCLLVQTLDTLFLYTKSYAFRFLILLPPSMSSVQFLELLAGEEGEW